MNKIVFENEHLQVIFAEGDSEYLLITFGDQNLLAGQGTFFAQTTAQQYRLNTLGFVAKTANWYPKASMVAAKAAISDLLKSFQTKILHGQSMGGYASIKYSKLFDASTVLAYTPQYSIDPQVCANHDKRFTEAYAANIHQKMTISADDLQGQIVVCVDPAFAMDYFHADQLQKLSAQLKIIATPMLEQHVGTALATPECLHAMLQACMSQQLDRLAPLIRQYSRYSPARINILIQRASGKHAGALIEILKKLEKNHAFFSNDIFKDHVLKLLLKFLKSGDTHAFIEMIGRFHYFNIHPETLRTYLDSPKNLDRAKMLKNHHGDYVAYDLIHHQMQCFGFAEIQSTAYLIPVYIQGSAGLIGIRAAQETRPILYHQNVFSIEDDFSAVNSFLIFKKIEDFYVIIGQQYYATAQKNGQLMFSVSHLKAWEKFTVEQPSAEDQLDVPNDAYPVGYRSDAQLSLPRSATTNSPRSHLLTYTYWAISIMMLGVLLLAALSD